DQVAAHGVAGDCAGTRAAVDLAAAADTRHCQCGDRQVLDLQLTGVVRRLDVAVQAGRGIDGRHELINALHGTCGCRRCGGAETEAGCNPGAAANGDFAATWILQLELAAGDGRQCIADRGVDVCGNGGSNVGGGDVDADRRAAVDVSRLDGQGAGA